MASNPYAAPGAAVADVGGSVDDAQFIAEGQAVPVGNAGGWIAHAWKLFKQHPLMWIALLVLTAVLWIVLSFIPFLGQLALCLLTPVISAGYMIGSNAVDRGEALTVGHLFAGFKQGFSKLLVIGAVSLAAFIAIFGIVMVVAGVSLFAVSDGAQMDPSQAMGFLLGMLIAFALLLPVYMAMWFAPALVALNDMAPIDALKTSFFACLKNILPFLWYSVLMFLLMLVAMIPFGLGMLVMGPVMILSIYTAYRDIFYQ